jgi:FkbM family methyltransferase
MQPPVRPSLRFRVASQLARSPLHPPLRWMAAQLERYMDVANNYNNCEFALNGEGEVITRGAPHWSLALDLGANHGDWALAVTAANPACRVHCFEPSPRTAVTLRGRVAGAANVTVHNVGVGEREGTLAFHDYGDGSVLSSFLSREGSTNMKAEQVIDVPVVSLDAFLDAHHIAAVDYAKIDTEGYEMPILRGARQSLQSRRIRCLQFEYGGTWLDAGESIRNAGLLLKEHGWTLYRLLADGVMPVHYDHRRDENFKYANFVATGDDAVLREWGVRVIGR